MRRSKGLSFYRKKRKVSSGLIKEIFSWIFGIFLSVILAFIIVYSVGMTTSVIGESMEPGLYSGQTIFINRFLYRVASPKRDDVIVFLPNGNQNSHFYVKRVVAVPGDKVQIINGILYVNGEMAENTEMYDKMADAGIAENEITLQNEEYFVLGDNRNNSEDSRSANVGVVNENDIIGKAWFRWMAPESGIGFIK
ncbi:MAG: signal peptidase I [Lachnospiraceae bacterium]|nr:signal peptidase I [Lachnospiraceae bacterium]